MSTDVYYRLPYRGATVNFQLLIHVDLFHYNNLMKVGTSLKHCILFFPNNPFCFDILISSRANQLIELILNCFNEKD